MYVFKLNKKIILLFIFILLIFLINIIIHYSNSIETSSIPVSNIQIVLDAGHGLPDSGASSNSGITEENINLSIVFKLQSLLESSGCNIILTRSDENGIYSSESKTIKEKKISDLKNRVDLINNSNSDLLISIHLNKFDDSKYSGWQTFYKNDNGKSKDLAASIQDNINYYISKKNNRVPLEITGKYIIDNSTIPSVIVECGFLSNQAEANLLTTNEYQEKIAWGIYTGILNYINKNQE